MTKHLPKLILLTVIFDADMKGFSILHEWKTVKTWDWETVGLVVGPFRTLRTAMKYGEKTLVNFTDKDI
jgi:hypothetical protein